MDLPILLNENNLTTKIFFDVHDAIEPIQHARMLHITLIIFFLVVLTFFLVGVIQLISKCRKRKAGVMRQVLSLDNQKSEQNVDGHTGDYQTKKQNLLLIGLEPKTQSCSNSGKSENLGYSWKLLNETPSNSSSKCQDISKKQGNDNFVIGCSNKPDKFLTSLSTPKRNYDELLDLLVSQRNVDEHEQPNESNAEETHRTSKDVSPLPTTNTTQLRLSNFENSTKKINPGYNVPEESIADPSDASSHHNNNTLKQAKIFFSIASNRHHLADSNAETCSDPPNNGIFISKKFLENSITRQPPPISPHVNRISQPHEYDPVYVPRHDSVGVLKRIDNESSYILNRRFLNGLMTMTNSNSGANGQNTFENITSDYYQAVPNMPTSAPIQHSRMYLSSPQPFSTLSSPSTSFSSPTYLPAIPPRISSKHPTNTFANSNNINNHCNNDSISNITSRNFHLPIHNVSLIHTERSQEPSKNISQRNSAGSSNPYDTIDETMIRDYQGR
ncbi:hypothetical protein HELRODRAFT_169023 [Helobdella robusta]|uniref:Uncharacterized protein n=1 Tax=Helobdella robusta TaxID=6412 RepID=T1F198_HELRO|nr:hypothetical protein HELRODRAFT_169023 [Helobdella robusta]ESO09083.1 hypothetical protein HELRODRAFT_169023 [Helobdella robusta]